MKPTTILLTGAAGFIGHATAARLLAEGHTVIGVDNLNSYYDPRLKKLRLKQLQTHPRAANFHFHKLDLTNLPALTKLAQETQPGIIIHLGAQAGVRYGQQNQQAYLQSNLIGHFNVLQISKTLADSGHPIAHLLYASSSSVYGANEKSPFEETDDVSRPVSLYAATKRADELITHAWSHQFGLAATGLRFFTVYGPWGRPDMSPWLFAQAIHSGQPIPLFNGGDLWRDFTFVDDIVEAIVRLMPHAPSASPTAHAIFNLGNQSPVRMTDFVSTLEAVTGKKAVINNLPWPPTEVYKTCADTSRLKALTGWAPSTPLKEGLAAFNDWFTRFHNLHRA